jgi:isopenicillin-N N-acyltransferase like protein
MAPGNNIKIIEAKGKPKEIGRAIGEHGKEEIAANIDSFFIGKDSEETANRASRYWNAVWHHFPDYLAELQGMSDGSGIPLMRLFAYNLEEELDDKGEHCTTIAAKSKEGIILGHNEDWVGERKFYVVKARPDTKPGFISLDYAGQLPGSSAALNSAGVAFAGNSIDTLIREGGLPKSYLLRSLLETTSLHDVEKIMSLSIPASGNNSVIIFSEEQIIADLEWSPADYAIIRPKENYYAHTNHFMRLTSTASQNKEYQAQSSFRLSRANKLLKSNQMELGNLGIDAFEKILRDHEGREGIGSICKHLYEDRGIGSDTLASIIIEPDKGLVHALIGKPCRAEYKTYDI